MPKDNETIQLPLDGPLTPSEPAGFAPEQMIRCEGCLRANPPTRFACLYCEAPLPLDQSTAHLRKPILRQPEKHQPGFNCILTGNHLSASGESLSKAAELLKLTQETLDNLVALKIPIPVARTASRDEAQLVSDRLRDLSFSVLVLSDEDLGTPDETLVRVRSLQINDDSVVLRQSGGKRAIELAWSDLKLMVTGRLITQQVEVTERVSRRPENEIIDTSEFFSDEPIIDLYTATHQETWRIGTNNFDFSCLQSQKSFIAAENLKKLQELIVAKCPGIRHDFAYNELRNALQVAWPPEQETYSRGWRRERPGKYSLGALTANTNESQFTRYSRLVRYFAVTR